MCTGIRRGFSDRRNRRERHTLEVINELDVDVLLGETNRHARTFIGASDFLPDAPTTQLLKLMFLFGSHFSVFTD